MNFDNLQKTYSQLRNHMRDAEYVIEYVWMVDRVYQELISHPNREQWKSYEDAVKDLSCGVRKKSVLRLIADFDLNGNLPVKHVRRSVLLKQHSYDQLNDFFKHFVSASNEAYKSRNPSARTSDRARISVYSTFCLHLQNNGCECFKDATEEIVINFFTQNGEGLRSKNEGEMIRKALLALTKMDPDNFPRVASYIPHIPQRKKNIEYLRSEELEALLETLNSSSSMLSSRDKAIMLMLIYTGIRCSDICEMKLRDIDWEHDVIRLIQKKTSVPIEIPLRSSYGNALWEYMHFGRENSSCENVFLSRKNPERGISSSAVYQITCNAFKEAGLRCEPDSRRGSHLFRHNYVRKNLEAKAPAVVISSMIGHISPESINAYLNADFMHLKGLSLSVEPFLASKDHKNE